MRRIVWSAVFGAILAGCAVQEDLPPAPTLPAPAIAGIGEVGRAIAIATSSRVVRLDIRDALRASPFVSHKVRLVDLLSMEGKPSLLLLTSRALKESPGDVLKRVRELGDVDVFLGTRQFRTTWTGVEELVVASGSTIEGMGLYDDHGVSLNGSTYNSQAVLTVMPAESHELLRRADPDVGPLGETVARVGESNVAGYTETLDRNGILSRLDFYDVARGRIPERGHCSGNIS